MKINHLISFSVLFVYLFITNIHAQVNIERQWPNYRGYKSSGVLDNAKIPEFFSIDKSLNIKWTTSIPGLGHSSPVIWGDRLFITTAVSPMDKEGIKTGIYGDGFPVADSSVHEWKVICLNKNTGKTVWERTAYKGVPRIKRHPKSTHANASVATDGNYVVAFFGSEGLYCYDFEGDLVWKKNFGILKAVAFNLPAAEWEFASSPVIYNGILIIQCDVLENSFLATYDLKSGKELWRVNRYDHPCWCTPNVYKNGESTVIAVNGYKHRGGYDLLTGKEVWKMSGGGDVPIPTPVTGDGLLYFNSAHGPSSPIIAVKANAIGDITLKPETRSNEYIAWSIPRGGSYIHTLLLYNKRLYNINWNGTVQCYDPSSGTEIWSGKLGKNKSFIASPVASDGRIFIVSEDGVIFVLQDGDHFKQLDEIPLNDICLTAPAITEGMIFFRTQRGLIAAGGK